MSSTGFPVSGRALSSRPRRAQEFQRRMSRQMGGSGRAAGGRMPPPDGGAPAAIAGLPPGPRQSPPARGRAGPDAARLAGALGKGAALPAAKRKPVDYSPDTAAGLAGARAANGHAGAPAPAPSAAIEVVDLDYNPFLTPPTRADSGAAPDDGEAAGGAGNPFVTPPRAAPAAPAHAGSAAAPAGGSGSLRAHALASPAASGELTRSSSRALGGATSGELARSGSRGRLLRARSDLAPLASAASAGSAAGYARSLEHPRPPLRSLRSEAGPGRAGGAGGAAPAGALPPRPGGTPERARAAERAAARPPALAPSPFGAAQLDLGPGAAGSGPPAGRGLRGRLLSSRRSSVDDAGGADMITPYRRVRRV